MCTQILTLYKLNVNTIAKIDRTEIGEKKKEHFLKLQWEAADFGVPIKVAAYYPLKRCTLSPVVPFRRTSTAT